DCIARAESSWLLRLPSSSAPPPYTALFRSTPEGILTRRGRAASAEDEEGFDLVIGADGLHSRVRPVIDGGRAGPRYAGYSAWRRSEEHTSELQSRFDLVCRLLLETKKKMRN